MKDRHLTHEAARAHALRTARRLAWDGIHPRSICGKSRPVPGEIPSLEVCVQRPNHEASCFVWED